jgi:WD40 repeat protein
MNRKLRGDSVSGQVRLWDVPTGKNVETLNHTKAVHAVGVAPGGGGPVAFGGAEGALRLWDPRTPKAEDLVSTRKRFDQTGRCVMSRSEHGSIRQPRPCGKRC